MRRTGLVWFAAGAAVSALAYGLAGALISEKSQSIPILEVEERFDRLSQMTVDQQRENAPLNGQLLRDCGTDAFEMDAIIPDGGGQARVAVTPENEAAIQCILREGPKQGFQVNLTFGPPLKTHKP